MTPSDTENILSQSKNVVSEKCHCFQIFKRSKFVLFDIFWPDLEIYLTFSDKMTLNGENM